MVPGGGLPPLFFCDDWLALRSADGGHGRFASRARRCDALHCGAGGSAAAREDARVRPGGGDRRTGLHVEQCVRWQQ